MREQRADAEGQRKFDSTLKRENFQRIERQYGSFTRSFTLPADGRYWTDKRVLQGWRPDYSHPAARRCEAETDRGKRRLTERPKGPAARRPSFSDTLVGSKWPIIPLT